jgi:hypothetical protein
MSATSTTNSLDMTNKENKENPIPQIVSHDNSNTLTSPAGTTQAKLDNPAGSVGGKRRTRRRHRKHRKSHKKHRKSSRRHRRR